MKSVVMAVKAMTAVALAAALCACAGSPALNRDSANPMEKYFQPVPLRKGIEVQPLAAGEEPCVDHAPVTWTSDPLRMVDPYVARGYAYVGFSLATSKLPMDHEKMAIAQAKNLQASCVLVLKPTSADVPAATTAQAPAQKTAQAPVQTYAQGAAYFAATKNDRAFKPYGWVFADLLPEQRRERNRRTGAFVRYVLAGSPAAASNVQVGDIIIRFDGRPVANADALVAITQALVEEDSVIVSVDRRGQEMEIPVTIVPAALPGMPAALASALRELRELRDLRILTLEEYRAKRAARLAEH